MGHSDLELQSRITLREGRRSVQKTRSVFDPVMRRGFASRAPGTPAPQGECRCASTMVRQLGQLEARVPGCVRRPLGRTAQRTAAHRAIHLYPPGSHGTKEPCPVRRKLWHGRTRKTASSFSSLSRRAFIMNAIGPLAMHCSQKSCKA